MRCGGLAALLALLLCASAAAPCSAASSFFGSACGPRITFFPPGNEDRNIPKAWGKTAQMAAGNLEDDVMFAVVLASEANVPGTDEMSAPVLQLWPKHDLLEAGRSGVSEECIAYRSMPEVVLDPGVAGATNAPAAAPALADTPGEGGEPGAPAARRLLQGLTEQMTVASAARYTVQWSLNDSQVVDAGEFTAEQVPLIKLDMLAGKPDGYYCLKIKVTLLASTGVLGPLEVPLEDLHTTSLVCFYKLDHHPLGQANFTTCGEEFSVQISHIEPQPVPLVPGGSQPLFQPVAHFRTSLNRTKNYVWPPYGSTIKLDYWTLGTNFTGNETLTWKPQSPPHEGWYNVELEVSLATMYPTLMAIPHNEFVTFKDPGVPDLLKGQLQYAPHEQYPPYTLLGVQHTASTFRFMEGPPDNGPEIMVGAEVPFSWEFEGFGRQRCYINRQVVVNAAEGTCVSPINTKLPNRRNHTFTVVLEDVCGVNTTVEATFGTWGYAMTKVPQILDDSLQNAMLGGATFEIAGIPQATGSLKRSNATRQRPRVWNAAPARPAALGSASWRAALAAHLLLTGLRQLRA